MEALLALVGLLVSAVIVILFGVAVGVIMAIDKKLKRLVELVEWSAKVQESKIKR